MQALLRLLHSTAATLGVLLPLHTTLLRPQAFSSMRTGMPTSPSRSQAMPACPQAPSTAALQSWTAMSQTRRSGRPCAP